MISKPTAEEVIAFAGLEQSEAVVGGWIDDIAIIAKDCLEALSPDMQKIAIRYLVAGIMTTIATGGARMQSDSLGDASWSYVLYDAGQTDYGRMALKIAPCLGAFLGVKQYGAVRLIR